MHLILKRTLWTVHGTAIPPFSSHYMAPYTSERTVNYGRQEDKLVGTSSNASPVSSTHSHP
eukprot:6464927-Amphidinium_carterae.2